VPCGRWRRHSPHRTENEVTARDPLGARAHRGYCRAEADWGIDCKPRRPWRKRSKARHRMSCDAPFRIEPPQFQLLSARLHFNTQILRRIGKKCDIQPE
jgi:hypothetical protein